ncbi:uncharacterized protein N7515_006191 [Penicillium bovifimosum]|uniref:Fungal lipase-type domain-containing protein n=1 Tax=Penicillium bovifimosum TaxID=126998 RepID=A0A9W9GU97_9EURO|nr:uncharacterized protein N7515_006191 [Penicillium bovifimosum]KAJ5130152.1 hypothetical protein N7515_006191 [Penicillium bovifimosum]
MTSIFLILLLLYTHFLRPTIAQNETNHVSTNLFTSLEELSRLVDISYCVGTTGVQKPFECLSRCIEFPDLELVTTWNTGILLSDSCGYIALSHFPSRKRIIIAFRGTYSITNTIIDLSAIPQAYIPYTGDEDANPQDPQDLNPTTSPRCKNCTVHAGFLSSWLNTRKTILPHLTAIRQKHPDYEITLVGHSLGGAVAALAALEMRLKGFDPLVTTFGEPMVGNEAFVAFFNEQFGLLDGVAVDSGRFRRVTHVDDPVPLLPLREWGYAAHAGEIFIEKAGLPPELEDVRLCKGDYDPGCIAGKGAGEGLRGLLRDLGVSGAFGMEGCRESGGKSGDGGQVVLEDGRDVAGCGMGDGDREDGLELVRLNWSLIPARYRLWELFYAHRDYFWRIGLCVPGGDPTG